MALARINKKQQQLVENGNTKGNLKKGIGIKRRTGKNKRNMV